MLPIRGSAYIISIFNEQIGKGAMAYYLHRRHRVPGWEVGSVMLFVMFCEVFYLLFRATVGFAFSGASLPPAFALVPGWRRARCWSSLPGCSISAAPSGPRAACATSGSSMLSAPPGSGTTPFSWCGAHRRCWPR